MFSFSLMAAKRLFAILELFALSVTVCFLAGVDVTMGPGGDCIGGGMEGRFFLPCVVCFDRLRDVISVWLGASHHLTHPTLPLMSRFGISCLVFKETFNKISKYNNQQHVFHVKCIAKLRHRSS